MARAYYNAFDSRRDYEKNLEARQISIASKRSFPYDRFILTEVRSNFALPHFRHLTGAYNLFKRRGLSISEMVEPCIGTARATRIMTNMTIPGAFLDIDLPEKEKMEMLEEISAAFLANHFSPDFRREPYRPANIEFKELGDEEKTITINPLILLIHKSPLVIFKRNQEKIINYL